MAVTVKAGLLPNSKENLPRAKSNILTTTDVIRLFVDLAKWVFPILRQPTCRLSGISITVSVECIPLLHYLKSSASEWSAGERLSVSATTSAVLNGKLHNLYPAALFLQLMMTSVYSQSLRVQRVGASFPVEILGWHRIFSNIEGNGWNKPAVIISHQLDCIIRLLNWVCTLRMT